MDFWESLFGCVADIRNCVASEQSWLYPVQDSITFYLEKVLAYIIFILLYRQIRTSVSLPTPVSIAASNWYRLSHNGINMKSKRRK